MVQIKQMTIRQLWRPLLLLLIILCLFIASYLFGWIDSLSNLQPWIQQQGIWAPLVFFAVYLLLVIAAIPATPLGVAAGALFGSFYGVVIVSVASTIAASFAFLIARYIAKESVEGWIQRKPRMKRLYELTEKQGFIIVAITRLIPLFPYNLLNYGFGLTKISFRTYVFWTWACMLPGTIVVVVGSDALLTMATTGTIPWLLIGILIITVLLLFGITYVVKTRMDITKKS